MKIITSVIPQDVAMQVIGPVPIPYGERWEDGMPDNVQEKYMLRFWSRPESGMDLVMSIAFYIGEFYFPEVFGLWTTDYYGEFLELCMEIGDASSEERKSAELTLPEKISELHQFFIESLETGRVTYDEIFLWSEIKEKRNEE